jgi:hypothetical protein
MPAGFAPRFVIEAGFLVLLGVGAGFADLRPIVIVGVLAAGWLLVSLIELAIWHAQARAVVPFVPHRESGLADREQPAPEAEAAEPEPGWPEAEGSEPEVAYPLRADAGSELEPSEEIEAYTRVLGNEREGGPPSERAE